MTNTQRYIVVGKTAVWLGGKTFSLEYEKEKLTLSIIEPQDTLIFSVGVCTTPQKDVEKVTQVVLGILTHIIQQPVKTIDLGDITLEDLWDDVTECVDINDKKCKQALLRDWVEVLNKERGK